MRKEEPGRNRRARSPAAIAVLVLALGAGTARAHPVDALVDEALAGHPQLRRARAEAGAAREVPSRAGALPDPMLQVSAANLRVDDPALNGSPMTGLVVGLQQPLPFPGKLARRARVAARLAEVAERAVESSEARVALQVHLRYWELHYAERALAITRASERVINTLTDAVHARFSVGQAAQQDALQAQVAHSRLRSQLQERLQAVRSARRALNEALGREP